MKNESNGTTRRDFLKTTAILTTASVGILTTGPPRSEADETVMGSNVPALDAPEVLEKVRELGIGSAALLGPKIAKVDTFRTLRIVYTAGKAGIQPGGGIRVGLRHLLLNWSAVQTEKADQPGYLTASTPTGAPLTIRPAAGNYSASQNFDTYFAWHNFITEVIVGPPGLKSGETLTVIYGDRRGGSPGMKIQPTDETAFGFKVYADVLGNGQFLPLERIPSIEIVADEPVRLSVMVPSQAVSGRPIWCVVRAEDRFGNPATRYRGVVRLAGPEGTIVPRSHSFTEHDGGVFRFEGIVLRENGKSFLSVRSTQTWNVYRSPAHWWAPHAAKGIPYSHC